MVGEPLLEFSSAEAGSYQLGYSGDSLNLAINLARLGVPVRFGTAIGDDTFSEGLLAKLAGERVGTDLVTRCPGRALGLYLIEPSEPDRRVMHYWRSGSAASQFLGGRGLVDCLEGLGGEDTVLTSAIGLAIMGSEGRAAFFDWLAARPGRSLIFDANMRPSLWDDAGAARAAVARAISYSALVSASVEDLLHLDVSAPAEWLFETAPPDVELVLRAADLTIHTRVAGESRSHARTVTGEVVDATGAGDAFNAAYIAVRRLGLGVEAAVRAGRTLAVLVISQRGALLPRAATPDIRSLLA